MIWEFLLEMLRGVAGFFAFGDYKDSFPKPLSRAEEEYYLGRLAAGDDTARNVLIERNLRLVAHVARKFQGTGQEMDDLVSVGSIGLIKAVGTFREGKGVKFSTYAARCIENEILMVLRSEKKRRMDLYLSDGVGTDKDGNSISFEDIVGSDAEDVETEAEENIRKEKLLRAMKQALTPRERMVIAFRYGLMKDAPMTQKTAAKKLGISRSYVSRIEKRAMEKLRLALKGME